MYVNFIFLLLCRNQRFRHLTDWGNADGRNSCNLFLRLFLHHTFCNPFSNLPRP
jgi:hypothetical protein